jgi:cytochrome bd ubiquinol oxidase subunit I
MTALLLSRIQFAFTISFHIIFPAFSIGIAAWLAVLEGLHLRTGRSIYRRVFDLWLKVFGVAFGMGVVSGIVMAFQFGTNWSRLSAASGPIQGPLLAYETFTAFALEASFFGVLLFGRSRVTPVVYFISTLMVALGTFFSAFWIMVNNSWMQVPVGYAVRSGEFVPTDWTAIIFSPVVWVRFPHMLIASFITGATCAAAVGAWYLLKDRFKEEARVMVRMGTFLGALLLPMQMFFGHLNGDYVHDKQPAKFAAIEARWHDEQPAAEVLLAIPDSTAEVNRYELKVPVLGSLIATMTLDSKEVGLVSFPKSDRPPVAIPFFAFRVMVGCGLILLALAWCGSIFAWKDRLPRSRALLWGIFLSFPLPFIATITGWFTAEVGRQPWTIYGLLRTAEASTPNLSIAAATSSLVLFVCIYAVVFSFVTIFIFRLLRAGPTGSGPIAATNPKRPLAIAGCPEPVIAGPRGGGS